MKTICRILKDNMDSRRRSTRENEYFRTFTFNKTISLNLEGKSKKYIRFCSRAFLKSSVFFRIREDVKVTCRFQSDGSLR